MIYGPYNSDDELWSCDDVDMCNGFFVDAETGEYAYASTTFFPYMVGCWGPAYATHEFMPSCTSSGCGQGAFSGLSYSAILVGSLAMNLLF